MANTPARRSTTTTATARKRDEIPDTDLEVLSRDEDAGTMEVRLFDTDNFVLTDDVNSFLLVQASGGTNADFIKLLKSLVVVPEPEGKQTMEEVQFVEWNRFADCLGSQRKLTGERLMRLVNDITEAAGKESTDSSGS